ncbi:MAG: D-alanyl-D-alanine carboxypeptidase/D-alanyl-D-alanine-endopeptidase [Woeseia sp.]
MNRFGMVLLAVLFSLPLAADDELPAGVKSVLAHRNIPADRVSIHVRNLVSGEKLLAWRVHEARNPASVMKLVTTLVALDVLGPAYTWRTEAYFLGERTGSTLHGDLLLKGYGDPFLVTERIWQFQRQLRQAGIRRITGDLVIDDSWFEVGDYDPAAFDREPLRAYNVEPNALMSNFKVVRFLFEPDEQQSGVMIRLEPHLQNVAIDNRLSVTTGPCRGYRRGIAISPNDSFDQLTFSGRFPSGCQSYAMDRSVLSHNEFTYGLFRSLWLESGGELEGHFRREVVPEGLEPDMAFESPPLADVISKVNKHSNNVMARQLLYTLAAQVNGPPGTENGGRTIVRDWLARHNFDFPELTLDNGAGLSRSASITASHMIDLLSYAWRSPYMPEYLSSMSLAGLDGTLSRRFRDESMQGMAHMKTGSLDDVSAIAGYLQGRSGDRYAIALFVNHTDSHRGTGEEVQEALLRWVREH